MKQLRALAFILALLPVAAAAQQFPTVQDKCVIGRIGTGTGSGPSQCIPFATLQVQLNGASGATANQIPVYQPGGLTTPKTVGGAGGFFDIICSSTIGQTWVRLSSGWGCTSIGFVNPVWYGADPTGVADSTAAIAAAIAAVPSGGTIFYPCGTYLVSGSGTAVFSYSKVITHVGVGYCSEILLSASIPTTRDIFYFNPTTAVQGGGFKNILVAPVSGSPGQHVLHIDTTANTAASVSDFVVENSQFVQTGGGLSLYLHGRCDGVGTKFSRFVGNQFLGGVNALCVGDTVNFGPKNFFGGAAIALLASQAPGAGNLIINHNNIVSNGFQGIVIDSGTKPIIYGNEIENAFSATLSGSAVVDIRGATATVVNPTIEDNQIQVNASTGNPTPLRIGTASGAIVDRNYIAPATAQAGIVISSGAIGAQLGCLNIFVTASPYFTNAGSGTQLCTPNNILATAVNFNSVADTTVPIVVSTPRWVISSIQLSGCTGSISSAHFGIFTGAGGTGTTILSSTLGTITTASDNTANNMQLVAPTTGFTQSFTPTSVFFRVITAQGSAVTCNLNVIPIGLP